MRSEIVLGSVRRTDLVLGDRHTASARVVLHEANEVRYPGPTVVVGNMSRAIKVEIWSWTSHARNKSTCNSRGWEMGGREGFNLLHPVQCEEGDRTSQSIAWPWMSTCSPREYTQPALSVSPERRQDLLDAVVL